MMEIDHEYTDEVVCPYCGHEHSDSWEFADQQDSYECDDCGKKFSYTSETTRHFTTKQVPCLNGESHEWKTNIIGMDPFYPDAKRCRWCGKMEYGERKKHG